MARSGKLALSMALTRSPFLGSLLMPGSLSFCGTLYALGYQLQIRRPHKVRMPAMFNYPRLRRVGSVVRQVHHVVQVRQENLHRITFSARVNLSRRQVPRGVVLIGFGGFTHG